MHIPTNHIIQPIISLASIEGFPSLAFTTVTGKLTDQTHTACPNGKKTGLVSFLEKTRDQI
jgi:hypothetical protein